MKKLRIAVIGVGNISRVHIESYLKNENVELVAFCDINEKRLKEKGEKYGITKLYTNVTEMCNTEKLDAVSVCTWNCAHAKCSIDALNAGAHVLCEKPMAMNAKEAEEMRDAAKKNGKLLMVGFVRRFGNDMKIVKEFSEDGFFGDFYYAKADYIRRNGCPGGWFSDKARSGGGPLIDLGVHIIDFVYYVFGRVKPISVYAATFRKLGNRAKLKAVKSYVSADKQEEEVCDIEDMATALIRFDNGAVLNVETSFSLNTEKEYSKIQLFGDKGGAKIDPELTLYGERGGYMTNVTLDTDTALEFDGLFANEINHFVDCLKEAKECISPAEDGIVLMKILDAAYESARTGHEVLL